MMVDEGDNNNDADWWWWLMIMMMMLMIDVDDNCGDDDRWCSSTIQHIMINSCSSTIRCIFIL